MNMITEIIRAIEAKGGTVVRTRAGHYKVIGPDGIVFIPCTPSEYRGNKNIITKLRRHTGLDIETLR